MSDLKSFQEVMRELSEKYGIQMEVLEAIFTEWIAILFYSATGKNPRDSDELLKFKF